MPMSKRLAILAGALALAGCGDPAHSVILGPEQGQIVGEQCSRPNPPRHESTWTPGPADIQHLEQDLPQLDALVPGNSLRPGDPLAYDRQYFGILVGGRPLIYVNAFADKMANKEWQKYAIVICDGGAGAWGAVYDPAARKFSDFAFNG